MADEKNAEVVSGEEKITDEDNESVMSDGLMQIFKPAVQELDEKVLSVRYDWFFSLIWASYKIVLTCSCTLHWSSKETSDTLFFT